MNDETTLLLGPSLSAYSFSTAEIPLESEGSPLLDGTEQFSSSNEDILFSYFLSDDLSDPTSGSSCPSSSPSISYVGSNPSSPLLDLSNEQDLIESPTEVSDFVAPSITPADIQIQ